LQLNTPDINPGAISAAFRVDNAQHIQLLRANDWANQRAYIPAGSAYGNSKSPLASSSLPSVALASGLWFGGVTSTIKFTRDCSNNSKSFLVAKNSSERSHCLYNGGKRT